MSHGECVFLVKQFNHSKKLKLAQWLIQIIAKTFIQMKQTSLGVTQLKCQMINLSRCLVSTS